MNTMQREFLRGGLEISVLSILARFPLHGYGLILLLRNSFGGELKTASGTLYPLLRRLKSKRLVTGEWRNGTGRKKIRVYSLTRSGRSELAKRGALWGKVTRAVSRIVGAQEE